MAGLFKRQGVRALGRGLLFWTLFPLVIPQAFQVRRNAPRAPAAKGPLSGCVGSGKPLRLAAIGDSVIAGVGAATVADALPGRVAEGLAGLLGRRVSRSAYGLIGATSSTLSRSLVPALPREPFDAVVVSVGVNDVTSLRTTAQWLRDLGHALDELRAHSPRAMIALLGVPPLAAFPLLPQPLRAVMGIRARILDDAAREELARRPGVVHVPIEILPTPDRFASDGFHPSPASYSELGRQVALALLSGLTLPDTTAANTDTA